MARFPCGERDPIALELVCVKIENARVATAAATILELRLPGRHRHRVVLGRRFGHDGIRMMTGIKQYRGNPPGALPAAAKAAG